MKIAGADDPETAAEAERSDKREAYHRRQAERTQLGPVEHLFERAASMPSHRAANVRRPADRDGDSLLDRIRWLFLQPDAVQQAEFWPAVCC